MIEIKLEVPEEGLKNLSQLPVRIRNNMFHAMVNAGRLIERTSQTKYLTGPYPQKLAVDRGFLRAGIFSYASMGTMGGELGRVTITSKAWYGKVHEQWGIPGTWWTIRAKTAAGMTFFWKRKGIWLYHVKKVLMPARPFLRPAVYDNLEAIKALLQRVLTKSIAETK